MKSTGNNTSSGTSGAFEQVLLSSAEMCYSVAFALTRNPDRAQDLARHALTWAWHLRDSPDAQKNIKHKLLKLLRERFLQHYCHVSCGLGNETTNTHGEEIQCIAQNVNRNLEKVSRSVRTAMSNS